MTLQNDLDVIIRDLKKKIDEEAIKVDDKCLAKLQALMEALAEYYFSCMEVMFETARNEAKKAIQLYVDMKIEETLESMKISLDRLYSDSDVKGARYGAFREMREMLKKI